MTTKKIRINDEVIIITGKDKGKRGIVRKFLSKSKVIVEGLNLIKKHQKPIPSINQLGGIIDKESKIDISNIAIFNSDINKSDRVKFILKNGKKLRAFKANNKIVK